MKGTGGRRYAPAWLPSCRQLCVFGFFIALETQCTQAVHVLNCRLVGACSCLNASLISASRRLFRSNAVSAASRCFAVSIKILLTGCPKYNDEGIHLIW
jgi:hypothetical protein